MSQSVRAASRLVARRHGPAFWPAVGVVLGCAVSLAGCLTTTTGRPVHGPRPISGVRAIPGLTGPIPDHWVRVFVGPLPRPKLMAYVRTAPVSDDPESTLVAHWVYDDSFQCVGLMSDKGGTVRFDRFGRTIPLGVLSTEQGILAILGFRELEPNPVRIVPMPAP